MEKKQNWDLAMCREKNLLTLKEYDETSDRLYGDGS